MYKKRGIRLPIAYFFQNHLFDLINGTDTHIWLPKEKFTHKPKNLKNGVLYMSSWTSTIKKSTLKAFKIFSINPNEVTLIDIGCGKGKVLCIWAKMFSNIKKIVGIDYNQELVDICKKNINKFLLKNVYIKCCDATEINFDEDNNINLIYLYNPFNEKVLKKIIGKISNKTIIIYVNPIYKKVLISNSFSEYYDCKTWHENSSYAIYSNIKYI